MESVTYYNQDDLLHYGVIGMKWGIKRGNAAGAYAKASKKLAKIDKRIEKHQAKARKMHKKTDGFDLRRSAHEEKAQRATQKSIRQMRKAEKWVKKMDKAFKDTSFKLTKDQIAIGRKYSDMLNTRSAVAYYK